MPYSVIVSLEFEEWFTEQMEDLQDKIAVTVALLEEHGPSLRRPFADTLTGSTLSHLEELRVKHRGKPYRILFAFDPNREALLLIGCIKSGDTRWYKRMIPIAEEIFQRHVASLHEE
ncbi:MAG: type II toxin-antitoxin system RelE/ParE family toxin [Trueperaceae bacterium]|nr:MAG: type II toxin-antitoxin system RelE/ParE family toxin [Trueperaceae bacterium]